MKDQPIAVIRKSLSRTGYTAAMRNYIRLTIVFLVWFGYSGLGSLSLSADTVRDDFEIPPWTTEDFYDAIARDDVKQVEEYLSDKTRSTKKFLSYYLLDNALELERDHIARLMVEAGAGVNTLSAVQHENMQILEEMLKRGVEPCGASLAAERGNLHMLNLLLSHGEDDFSTIGAAQNGQLEALKLLLQHGADPEGLGIAILHGHKEVARLLLETGADPNQLTRHNLMEYDLDLDIPKDYVLDYLSPLHYAVLLQSREIVAMLLDGGANPNIVPAAITMRENRSDRTDWPTVLKTATSLKSSDADITKLLENNGASLTVASDEGDYALEEALYKAANKRDYQTVVDLLEAGAQPTGFGKFFYAFSGSYDPKIIEAFAEAGADPDIYLDHYPYTPTAMALSNRDLGNFRHFIEVGTTIDDLLISWYMKIACVKGLNEAIETLWNLGNTRDFGEILSPVSYGHVDTVEFLLARGIKPMFLRHAVEKGHVQIVKMLLEAGADPNQTNSHDERSILELAYESESAEIIWMLETAGAIE